MFRKTTEDYLKTILGMTENSGGVRNTDLAKKLGIKKPSVTSAVKQLEEKGYFSRTENGSIILTASGKQIASGQ
ncbi:MAG: metal-dependent transcriptional regulator [Ruminococcus sp.]|nr:metal-dependent transcriptional regulator [Ruminococcus sp.]